MQSWAQFCVKKQNRKKIFASGKQTCRAGYLCWRTIPNKLHSEKGVVRLFPQKILVPKIPSPQLRKWRLSEVCYFRLLCIFFDMPNAVKKTCISYLVQIFAGSPIAGVQLFSAVDNFSTFSKQSAVLSFDSDKEDLLVVVPFPLCLIVTLLALRQHLQETAYFLLTQQLLSASLDKSLNLKKAHSHSIELS